MHMWARQQLHAPVHSRNGEAIRNSLAVEQQTGKEAPMNVEQLLAIVSDLSIFTSKEQLVERLLQCQAAYDQLYISASGKADGEKAKMLLAAIAGIQNKIAAMR